MIDWNLIINHPLSKKLAMIEKVKDIALETPQIASLDRDNAIDEYMMKTMEELFDTFPELWRNKV